MEPKLTTVGQLLINSTLPEEHRDYERVWDKSSMRSFLTEMAQKMNPDEYREMIQRLTLIGLKSARQSNRSSFTLEDLKPPKIKQELANQLRKEVRAIVRSEQDPKVRNERIVDAALRYQKDLVDGVYQEALKNDNPFAMQVFAGARGNKNQLASMIGTDLLYSDNKGRPVPIPVLNSYAEGVDPVEYWAGSYGARAGSIDVKLAVGEAGYFAKRLTAAAHRLVATDEDIPDGQGLMVETDDPDSIGSILARDEGEFKRGTYIDSKVLKALNAKGIKRAFVYSPIAAVSAMGGLPRLAAGIREHGKLAETGMNVGITAAQAIAEPVSQGMLNCLAKGTLVRMADGSAKAIEEIVPGDLVLGADRRRNSFPVKVNHVFDNGVRDCHRTVFRAGNAREEFISVDATLDHKILARTGKWPWRKEDYVDDVVPLGTRSGSFFALRPTSCVSDDSFAFELDDASQVNDLVSQTLIGSIPTYDIEVDHPDHLFVLANGLIVSNSKHGGGVAKGKSKRTVTGFAYLNQLVEVPKTFTDGAPVAKVDGSVGKVEPAPQGGNYVYVNNERYYVPAEQAVTVKPGQALEAGDALSDGVINPKDIADLKGIGEARRRFVQQFKSALQENGLPVHRRNVEVVARGLINQVEVTEPDAIPGAYPEDIVSYDYVASRYEPRKGFQTGDPDKFRNHYLEKPVMHYSIGTRLTPSVVKELKDSGFNEVVAHPNPPPFRPTMTRAMESLVGDRDWMVQLGGFNLKKTFLENVQRGSTSQLHGTSWIPALASGEISRGPKGTY